MITVGEILKNKRLEKKLSLVQIEKATKIRAKFLELIEQNQLNKIPPITARGFVKNYANYLDVPEAEILAFFRRQSEETRLALLPTKPLSQDNFKITPHLFTVASIIIFLLGFLSFLSYQYILSISAPQLKITKPPENIVVQNDEIEITGKTDPDASVTINNQLITPDGKGNFQVKIPLSAGLNSIVITSSNRYQRSSTVTRHLRLEAP